MVWEGPRGAFYDKEAFRVAGDATGCEDLGVAGVYKVARYDARRWPSYWPRAGSTPWRDMAFTRALLRNLKLCASVGASAVLMALLASSLLAAASANVAEVAVNYLVESFAYAIYAVYIAISLTAGGRDLALELNVFSSYKVVYSAKISAFAMVPPSARGGAGPSGTLEAFVKIATSTSIFALGWPWAKSEARCCWWCSTPWPLRHPDLSGRDAL